jgi:hypothetical protein
MGTYIVNKRWRLKYPRKRGKGVTAYYNRHRYKGMNRKRYSKVDEELIRTKMINGKRMFDREIAALIGRSLKAIQIHRCIMKNRSNRRRSKHDI